MKTDSVFRLFGDGEPLAADEKHYRAAQRRARSIIEGRGAALVEVVREWQDGRRVLVYRAEWSGKARRVLGCETYVTLNTKERHERGS